MLKLLFFMVLQATIFTAIYAHDQKKQIQTVPVLEESSPLMTHKKVRKILKEQHPEPNRWCQCVAASISCIPALISILCTDQQDLRDCNPLHKKYVEPFFVSKKYEDNMCCQCSYFFCPCIIPQSLDDEFVQEHLSDPNIKQRLLNQSKHSAPAALSMAE